ncbi:MAG: amino acid ABC transporter permease [Clostridia bacterium]|nr:amino acid ABC transporter permease [Clostridia bacterium]
MSSLWLVSTTSFFNFSFLPKYTIYFAQGILYTLLLSIVAVALAVLPALGLALMRLSKNKVLKTLSGAYIALFRSTPLLVQLALIYYGLFGVAGIQLPSIYVLGYINLAQFVPGAVALALNSAAYVAEIFRGGILAVDKGQMEAARSLGLTQWQGMKFVVLPQAIKNILPALANEVITMVKESSICSTYGMMELMWGAKTVAATTYVTLGPYVLAAIIYFCVNFPASKAIEAVERRMRRGDNQ